MSVVSRVAASVAAFLSSSFILASVFTPNKLSALSLSSESFIIIVGASGLLIIYFSKLNICDGAFSLYFSSKKPVFPLPYIDLPEAFLVL